MKELVCIVCPRGCRLKGDEENGYAVSGNSCPRGEVYGKKDLAPAFTNSAKEARGGNGAPKKGFRKPKTNR